MKPHKQNHSRHRENITTPLRPRPVSSDVRNLGHADTNSLSMNDVQSDFLNNHLSKKDCNPSGKEMDNRSKVKNSQQKGVSDQQREVSVKTDLAGTPRPADAIIHKNTGNDYPLQTICPLGEDTQKVKTINIVDVADMESVVRKILKGEEKK